MRWFDRWFRKKCIAAWESRDEPEEVSYSNKIGRAGSMLVSSSDEEPWGDGLRINVKRIHGGTVVTFFAMTITKIAATIVTTSFTRIVTSIQN